jgi:hypothetical protein
MFQFNRGLPEKGFKDEVKIQIAYVLYFHSMSSDLTNNNYEIFLGNYHNNP